MVLPRNLIGGVATVAIGAAYLAMASSIRVSALDDSVGPAGFPKALAYGIIGLGLILCLQSLLAMRAGRLASPAGAGDEAAGEEGIATLRGTLRALGMLGLGVAYLLVVRWLGYVPSIALLIVAAALYLGTPFSWRVVAIGVAGAVLYWVVFVWILGIPQPAGVLARWL